jgi:hypothetical protein
MSLRSIESAEALVADASKGGATVAYQTGVLYPGFTDAPREDLAALFERHGLAKAAKRMRDVDEVRALSLVVGRVGANRRDGLSVTELDHKDGDHVTSYQVERSVQTGTEQAAKVPGARVFSCPAGIFVAPPIGGAADPACMAFADQLRRQALRLVPHADAAVVSRILSVVLEEAHAYRFIARGSYVLRAGDPTAERVVACLRELRSMYYDPTTRTGLRASVVDVTQHGDNATAMSDAVIDDAEKQAAELLAKLKGEKIAGKAKYATLARRRSESVALLNSLGPVRDMLAGHAARLERICSGIAAAYAAAQSAADLEIPDWLEAEGATLGAAERDPEAPTSEPEIGRAHV